MKKSSKVGPFPNNLKTFRESKNLTQQELADILKERGFRVSGSYISQIEAGFKNIPYGLAIAICIALGKNPNEVTEIFLPTSFTGSENNLLSLQ